jgi:hypothetical protein
MTSRKRKRDGEDEPDGAGDSVAVAVVVPVPAHEKPSAAAAAPLAESETKASLTPAALQAKAQAYQELGYAVFAPNEWLTASQLSLLRKECDLLLAHATEELQDSGCVVEPIVSGSLSDAHPARIDMHAYGIERARSLLRQTSAAASATASSDAHERRVTSDSIVRDVLFHPHTCHLVRALLKPVPPTPPSPPRASGAAAAACDVKSPSKQRSPLAHSAQSAAAASAPTSSATSPSTCYFFNEHFVVKPAQSDDTAFAWHTDAQEQLMMCLQPADTTAYLSLWIALDDMTQENGTLCVLPRATKMTAGTRTYVILQ